MKGILFVLMIMLVTSLVQADEGAEVTTNPNQCAWTCTWGYNRCLCQVYGVCTGGIDEHDTDILKQSPACAASYQFCLEGCAENGPLTV